MWPIIVIGVRTVCTKRDRSPYAIGWSTTPPGRGAPSPWPLAELAPMATPPASPPANIAPSLMNFLRLARLGSHGSSAISNGNERNNSYGLAQSRPRVKMNRQARLVPPCRRRMVR